MNRISRRALARYAVEELSTGRSAAAVAKQLAGVLAETGRAAEVDFLLGDIAWELEQRGLVTSATVTTATPLTKGLESRLKSRLKAATGTKEVQLSRRVDKSVIGGLKIETSTRIWDDTIKRQLNQLREGI